MVWEPGEEAWEAKLAALHSYRRTTGHLAPRQDAIWDGPVGGGPRASRAAHGQPPSQGRPRQGQGALPRCGAAGGDRPRRELPWQRHYRLLADLVDGSLPDIQAGVLMDGEDIGRRLER